DRHHGRVGHAVVEERSGELVLRVHHTFEHTVVIDPRHVEASLEILGERRGRPRDELVQISDSILERRALQRLYQGTTSDSLRSRARAPAWGREVYARRCVASTPPILRRSGRLTNPIQGRVQGRPSASRMSPRTLASSAAPTWRPRT